MLLAEILILSNKLNRSQTDMNMPMKIQRALYQVKNACLLKEILFSVAFHNLKFGLFCLLEFKTLRSVLQQSRCARLLWSCEGREYLSGLFLVGPDSFGHIVMVVKVLNM